MLEDVQEAIALTIVVNRPGKCVAGCTTVHELTPMVYWFDQDGYPITQFVTEAHGGIVFERFMTMRLDA